MFNTYPYVNLTDLNLDWLLSKFNEVYKRLDEFVKENVITFGDPIQWSIVSQYTTNTMVIDSDGTAYLSKQPVPVGIAITNTDYWQPIFNYDDNINALRANVATNLGESGVLPSALEKGALVWYKGALYVTTAQLAGGSVIVPGTNAERVTLESWVLSLIASFSGDIAEVDGKIDSTAETINARITSEIAAEAAAREGAVNAEKSAREAGDVANTQGIESLRTYTNEQIAELREEIGDFTGFKTFANVDEMLSGFKQEDRICFVVNSSVILGDGMTATSNKGNYYKWDANPKSFEYELENGGYAYLIVPDFEPAADNDPYQILPAIMSTAYSYCGVGVTYTSNSGPFMPEPGQRRGMQCSQFINTLLNHMPYELSKLSNDNNANFSGSGAFHFYDSNGNSIHPSANQMAHYAALHGWLNVTNKYVDVEIGDVVFYRSVSGSYPLVDWNGIVHCAMVIGKARGIIQTVECGGTTALSNFVTSKVKMGADTDGVDIFNIAIDDASYSDLDGVGYELYGYARFPMNFATVPPLETLALTPKARTPYNSGDANSVVARPVPYTPGSVEHFGRYGILTFDGYSSETNNKSGFFFSAWTYGTSFPTQSGQTVANSQVIPCTGGILVMPFRKDGDAHPVRVDMTARTNNANAGNAYRLLGGKIDLYN